MHVLIACINAALKQVRDSGGKGLENIGASMSHNPLDLHGLLHG
jgi:hypothetical protein